jgi:hypothetical protein
MRDEVMLKTVLAIVARICTRLAWPVIAISTLLGILCGIYVAWRSRSTT